MNGERWKRRVVARPVTGALVVALSTGAAACRERPRVPLGEVETAAPSPRPLDAAVERLLWERRPPAGVPDDLWPALRQVYDRRRYGPLWVNDPERLAALTDAVCWLDSLGLPTSAYFPEHIGRPDTLGTAQLAELDLRASAGLAAAARALAAGVIGATRAQAPWRIAPPPDPSDTQTEAIVLSRAPLDGLKSLAPRHQGYAELLPAYHRYRAVLRAGGWPIPGGGPELRLGASGEQVAALRARLAATGDGPLALARGQPVFDRAVEAAVRRFQLRHGLPPDGRVGGRTLAALQVPADERVLQIQANLERYRWLPRPARGPIAVAELFPDEVRLRLGGETNLVKRPSPVDLASVPPAFAESTWTLVLGGERGAHRQLGLRVATETLAVPGGEIGGIVSLLRASGWDSTEAAQAAAAGAGDTASIQTPVAVLAPTTWVRGGALRVRTDATGADVRLMALLRDTGRLDAPESCLPPGALLASQAASTDPTPVR